MLVARLLGEGKLAGADRVTRSALILGVGFMSACGVVFALAGRLIAAVFTGDATVIGIAGRLLLVVAVFQALDAVNVVLRGALRGAKDVRRAMIAGTTIAWIAIPGSAYLLGRVYGPGRARRGGSASSWRRPWPRCCSGDAGRAAPGARPTASRWSTHRDSTERARSLHELTEERAPLRARPTRGPDPSRD